LSLSTKDLRQKLKGVVHRLIEARRRNAVQRRARRNQELLDAAADKRDRER
jgi:hypothetical protein